MRIGPAIAVDVIAILVFAIVGRSSHGEAADLIGVAQTSWPFLTGAVVGILAGRIWRQPSALASGVAVWLGTLVVGLLLRYLSGGGIQLSFVIVTSIVLAVFLIGWRAAYGLIRRAARRPAQPTP